MNSHLSDILASNMVSAPNGQRLPLSSNIPRHAGELLQAWIAAIKPKRVLEVGMAHGVSSLFICDAIQQLPRVTYDIIDPYQSSEWQCIGLHQLHLAGYQDSYILHEEPSGLCLPRMLDAGCRFDFAFIDGWHTFDHALIDFFFINRMLNVGGAVVFDDVLMPSIRKLMRYISFYPCYVPLPLPTGFHPYQFNSFRMKIGLPRTRLEGFTKISTDERPWDWYHNF